MSCAESVRPSDLQLRLGDGTLLAVECWQDTIVRICRIPGEVPLAGAGMGILPSARVRVPVHRQETSEKIILKTPRLQVVVDKDSGKVEFLDLAGQVRLSETDCKIAPIQYDGHASHAFVQRWELCEAESLHGLGNLNLTGPDLRGLRIVGIQENTTDVVPILVSSGGYGVIWNNPAQFEFDASAAQTWSFSSPMGAGIDYFFIDGQAKEVIGAYRRLTGDAPLFPRWVYGYQQCRERYTSQTEVMEIAQRFRKEGFPVDCVIQDWKYWGEHGWNACRFDPVIFPDPAAMIRRLHDLNLHLTISVWPAFDEGPKGSPVYRAMQDAGHLIVAGDPKWQAWRKNCYNAFDPAARELFWRHVDQGLFQLGVDGWWLDATEPEFLAPSLPPRSFDLESRRNAYPLMATQTFYEGQRRNGGEKRVYILTRSAWLGLQRNGAAYWTGDTKSNWKTFAQQVMAGLNFAYTGVPYWNTDIGGFSDCHKLRDKQAWDELYVRWFQFGAFCPIFRSHGTDLRREPWYFGKPGEAAYDTLLKFATLRYRLLPYIYSCAWGVTHRRENFMKPLAMNYPGDPQAAACADQYFFGPSLMVCPVLQAAAATRDVYMPGSETLWYDFWTGQSTRGGQKVSASTPLATMPLYVRAGAIIPMGPRLQYVDEKPADPIELRLYRGADGQFELYEDEGDSYRYEQGACATIPIAWNEAAQTLVIGQRQGRFPGMLEKRTFHVVFVNARHGEGLESTDQPDATVEYTGQEVRIQGDLWKSNR